MKSTEVRSRTRIDIGLFAIHKEKKTQAMAPNSLSEHPCSAHIRHQLIVVPERLYDLSLSFRVVRIHRYDHLTPGRLFWGHRS